MLFFASLWLACKGGEDTAQPVDTEVDLDDTGSPFDNVGDSAPPEEEPCVALVGETAYETVQAAIDAAGDGGTVTVCEGSWQENLVIGASLTLEAADGAEVTLDGGGNGAAVQVTAGDVVLSGLTITGGTGTQRLSPSGDEDSLALRGGGVDAIDADSLRVEGCTVSGNSADSGAGVYGPSGGELTLVDTTVADNTAVDGGGGLIAYEGSLAIEGSTFTGNQAGQGGGLYAASVPSASVRDSSFEGNSAEVYGGGLLAIGTLELTLESVSFAGNVAEAPSPEQTPLGGGLLAYDGDALTLSEVDFVENGAGSGGGFFVQAVDAVAVTAGRVEGNEAGDGGGFYVYDVPSMVLDGVEVSGNVADALDDAAYGGGGVVESSGTVEVTEVSLVGNQAHLGGGLVVASSDALLVTRGTATDNEVIGNGGGVYVSGVSSVDVQGLTGSGNVASGIREGSSGRGAGLYVSSASELVVTGVELSGNTAPQGAGVYVRTSGEVELADSTLSDNLGADLLNEDGDPAYGYGVGFYVEEADAVRVSGTTATGGVGHFGTGGLVVDAGTALFEDCVFSWNEASTWPDDTLGYAGGLALYSVETATLSSVVFEANTAILGGGLLAYVDELVVDGGAFTGNVAGGGYGGGAYVDQPASASFYGTTFEDNGAGAAGAMHVGGPKDATAGALTLSSVSMVGNVSDERAGALHVSWLLDVRLSDTTLSDNVADTSGGGLFAWASNVTLSESTLTGNSAATGGGLMIDEGALVNVANSEVSGNVADDGGGCMLQDGGLGSDVTDWGEEADDNDPNDVQVADGSSFDYGDAADFLCDAELGCS